MTLGTQTFPLTQYSLDRSLAGDLERADCHSQDFDLKRFPPFDRHYMRNVEKL